MLVTFWGVRGSFPIARRDNIYYGGNSTCIQIQATGEDPLIIDGGSGLRVLGNLLLAGACGIGRGQGNFLVGHTHWDHVMGFPFFGPLYQKGNRFTFYSAGQAEADFQGILEGQQEELYFPVPFDELRADMIFVRINPREKFKLGNFSIESVQLNHPGITLGYRIEHEDAVVVVFTDTARIHKVLLGHGMKESATQIGVDNFIKQYSKQLVDIAQDADLLIHDSHFLDEEIIGKEHWGHSTAGDALQLALSASVSRLMLFHHAPEHNDATIDHKLALVRRQAEGQPILISAAREGMAVQISGKKKC